MSGALLLLTLGITTVLANAAAEDNDFDRVFDSAAQREQDPSKEALRRLFDKYGAHNSQQMTFEGFEHLWESLGLGYVVILGHDIHDHQTNDGQFRPLHDDHVHSQPDHQEDHADHPAVTSHDHQRGHTSKRSADTPAGVQQSVMNGTNISHCLTPVNILQLFHVEDREYAVSQQDFVHMCPTIIYQLDAHLCHPQYHAPCHSESINSRQHCRRYHDLPATDQHQRLHSEPRLSSSFTDITVWGSATVAVSIISLVGLVAVVLIPVMAHRTFYNHLLHFLVAVAIATLTGDALLHLLPHAVMPHDQHDDRPQHNMTSYEDHVEEDRNNAGASAEMVWKGLVVLAGIYVFFVTERLISLCRAARRHSNEKTVAVSTTANQRLSCLEDTCLEDQCHQSVINDRKDEVDACLEHETFNGEGNKSSHQHQHDHHQHHHDNSHGHSHDHSQPPSSIASAAWMVIMGDGLHNFTDGLAIGAAFANGFAGGIGTTTAVFCHELPHELGDFAVLLRSGMTVKQAVMYNMVSSVLAFTGMCFGVVLGTLHWTASSWVFALTAGIFIYVSLVDMLPEMTKAADESLRSMYLSLILDIIGLSLGVVLMTLIAFYEHDIQLLLTNQ